MPKDVLFRFSKRQPIFQKIRDLISIYQNLNMEANFYKKREWCGRVYSFYEPITHYIDYVADSLPNDKTVANIKHHQNRFLIYYRNRSTLSVKLLHHLFIFFCKKQKWSLSFKRCIFIEINFSIMWNHNSLLVQTWTANWIEIFCKNIWHKMRFKQ